MMEGFFRIIYALCIIFIRFPLYYLAPLEVHHTYNDTSSCNNFLKDFLYKSEYTKECNLRDSYKELDKLTEENIQEFLCLGIEDSVYKVCQYNKEIQQRNKIDNQKKFDTIIRDLMKSYETDRPNRTSKDFCNDLARYIPVHEVLKPTLSQLVVKFKKPELCFSICFDLESKFKTPLCAILLWLNKEDQVIAKIPTINSTIVKTDEADHENEDLEDKQGNNKDQLNTQQKTDSPKSLENKTKENKILHVKRPATNISTSNGTKNNSNINNNSNSNHNEQLSQSKKYSTTISNSLNPVEKSDSMTKTTLKPTSNPMTNNISESHEKPTSSSKEVDKKPVYNVNSQEPSLHIQTNYSKSKKKDKVDPEKNSITDKNVNQPVTETKSTKAFNNAADGSDHPKNAPTVTEQVTEIDQLDGADNPRESMSEPSEQRAHFENDEESHFLFYFGVISIGFIGGYTGYHNKKKLLAIVLKGRRSKNNRGRRRSSSPKYRRLDCTLEEAVTSQCNANVTHVIY